MEYRGIGGSTPCRREGKFNFLTICREDLVPCKFLATCPFALDFVLHLSILAFTGQLHMARFRRTLDLVATILMIVASAVMLYAVWSKNEAPDSPPGSTSRGRPSLVVPTEPIPLVKSATFGFDSAPVIVMLFSEFECPFCRKFAVESFPQFKAEYLETGKAQLVFRHLPLRIHPDAFRAAEAAECARRMDGFWLMHDALFSRPEGTAVSVEALTGFAKSVGLRVPEFMACLSGGLSRAEVKRDEALAAKLGIIGTPGFVVGRREGSSLRAVSIHRGVQSPGNLGAAVAAALTGK